MYQSQGSPWETGPSLISSLRKRYREGTIIAHAQILTAPRPVIGVYVQISECSHLSTPEVRLPFLRI